MREIVSDMLKKEKKWRIIFLVSSIILYPVLITVGVLTGNDLAGAMIFFGFVAWIFVAIMYLTCFTRKKNYKWFTKISPNPDAVLDGFNINKNNYSSASRVYLGDTALFYNYAFVIIPYSELAWVYIKQTNVNYNNVVQNAIIFTKSKKRYEIPCDSSVLATIVNDYLVNQNPDVLVGYTKENLKKYKES